MPVTTLRAVTQRPAGELLVAITVVEWFIGRIDDWRRYGKQLSTTHQLLGTVAIRQLDGLNIADAMGLHFKRLFSFVFHATAARSQRVRGY